MTVEQPAGEGEYVISEGSRFYKKDVWDLRVRVSNAEKALRDTVADYPPALIDAILTVAQTIIETKERNHE